jgi:hypothetical protein
VSLDLGCLPELDDTGIAALSSVAGLRHLKLDRCPLIRQAFTLPQCILRALRLHNAFVRQHYVPFSRVRHGVLCCRGHTLSKLQSLRWLESLSMTECPCITDSSLALLSEVLSIKTLNLNHCDKITDNGAPLNRVVTLCFTAHQLSLWSY